MSREEKITKQVYSFTFYKSFKDDMDVVAEFEKISTTALIEREVGRYIMNLRKASADIMRRKAIEKKQNKEKLAEIEEKHENDGD